jgi:UDP-N-acetylglucosamine 4,6-dehydratase
MLLVITGGTGSLGKAVLQQQLRLKILGISHIRILSRDDQKHVQLLRSYTGSIPIDCYIADVGDRRRMLFALRDAEYLIHAAALKHIDRFELDVPTGYKTNISGSENVAEGFLTSPVAKAGTLVSTDKAADPTTSYGVSKLAAEQNWLWNNTYQKRVAMRVVRYGNVFGSQGSVIGLWTDLAKKKEPLPITHPSSTRYFMNVNEAALFVLNSLNEVKASPIIPKMKSARMMDIAEMIWKRYNTNELQFKIVGLRENEKLHEILKSNGPSSLECGRFKPEELNLLYEEWLNANPNYS